MLIVEARPALKRNALLKTLETVAKSTALTSIPRKPVKLTVSMDPAPVKVSASTAIPLVSAIISNMVASVMKERNVG